MDIGEKSVDIWVDIDDIDTDRYRYMDTGILDFMDLLVLHLFSLRNISFPYLALLIPGSYIHIQGLTVR